MSFKSHIRETAIQCIKGHLHKKYIERHNTYISLGSTMCPKMSPDIDIKIDSGSRIQPYPNG